MILFLSTKDLTGINGLAISYALLPNIIGYRPISRRAKPLLW